MTNRVKIHSILESSQCVERSNCDIKVNALWLQTSLAHSSVTSVIIILCDVLAREERVNSNEIILHMCLWDEDQ